MMTIVIGGWALQRPSNLLNSLAAGALGILLYDPLQLFQAGFQLSFLVVLVIAIMFPVLQHRNFYPSGRFGGRLGPGRWPI
jgi:competence protein ComEC